MYKGTLTAIIYTHYVAEPTIVLTAADVAQPNTTNYGQVSGNSYINGTFTANTATVIETLRGGTTSTAASLNVGSNVMPTSNLTLEFGSITKAWGNGYFNNVRAFGDVEASYSSDINLKTDLKKMENALEVCEKINGYMFTWNTDDAKNGETDLGVIAQVADDVAVMYLGSVVERGPVNEILKNPKHPYTRGLLNALPDINNLDAPLKPIPGNIPSPLDRPAACVFRTRCPDPTHDCKEGNIEMGLIEVSPGHWVDKCCVNCG